VHLEGMRDPAVDEARELRSWGRFSIDDRGRIGVLGGHRFVLLDPEDRRIREVELPSRPASYEPLWLEADRWIAFVSTDKGVSAYWIDAASGISTPVDAFQAPRVIQAVRSGDGGFVVLGVEETPETESSIYGIPAHWPIPFPTFHSSILAFDRAGRRRWTSATFDQFSVPQFSPESITVEGEKVVVLGELRAGDTGTETARMVTFGKDGKVVRVVDPPGWHSHFADPRIASDGQGHLVVYGGYDHHPTIARISSDGAVLDRIVPSYDGRRTIDESHATQFDPAGHLWVNDGLAFLRLDGKGVVDRTVGVRRDPSRLDHVDVQSFQFDAAGRVYALDRRQGDVHVFDDAGRRVRILHPEWPPAALANDVMLVSPAGDVYLVDVPSRAHESVRARVHFAPDGKRIAVGPSDPEFRHQTFASGPESARWVWDESGTFRRITAQGKVEASLAAAQGTFDHTYHAKAAPDGSFVVMLGHRAPNDTPPGRREPLLLRMFASDGRPTGSLEVPPGAGVRDHAFDGQHLAVAFEPSLSDLRACNSSVVTIVLADAKGHTLFQLRANLRGRMGFVRNVGGNELWIPTDDDRIDRISVP
jgi:hypothetical protein